MKNHNIISLLLILTFYFSTCTLNAQTLNWKALDDTRQIVNVNIGLDYSLSFGAGYSYKLNSKLPIVLNVNFSMPSGEKAFDDFKAKTGGQICLLNISYFVGSISIYGIYRRYQTNLVRLQNFGSDMKGTFGYYKPKWFVATEVGFDKAIVTHFKHSKKFKDEIYANVVDGWYEPATGGNFYYGFSTGYSLKKTDFTLNLGKVVSQDYKTSPLIPFYVQMGCNIRFGK